MKFWDSSAVVPLVIPEATSRPLRRLFRVDPQVVAWWGTEIECVSAIARREREGVLAQATALAAVDRLLALRRGWHEIEPGEDLRATARRLLTVHPLRAADALQLAAALQAAEGHPSTLDFVSLDDRLVSAAQREGFRTVGT